jgi:hypothetical protein
VFWRDEVDIMYISHLLEFDVPLRQFFRGQVEAVSLVRNIMVLTKDTAQIASRKKDRPASMVPLYTWLFTSVGRNDIDLGRFGTD